MSKQEIKQVKPQDLIPYAKNSRTHTDAQINQVMRSIEEFGFTNPILLHKNTILAGHCRVEAAKRLGIKTVPCLSLDYLTPDQARAYVIADNKLAMNAGWDDDVLKQEIEDLLKADFDISLIGFDTSEFKDLGVESFAPEFNGDPDDVPEVPQNIHSVERGDIWQLGEHRLMCGDSTSEADVSRLMDGQKADMVFTDPPYGYSYESNHQSKHKQLKNDDKILDFFPVALKATQDNAAFYICGSHQTAHIWRGLVDKNLNHKNMLIWKKNNWSMGDLSGAYACQYEVIFFAHKGRAELVGERHRDVWEFDRDPPKEHPTQKPVELISFAISNHNAKAVLDLFGGSGSTLIACEKTGRKCYMMELDEHYCSVIIERWQQFTGKKAEKIA